MEKISELLKNVKERLASPLIFSFILSWMLFNWKVTVGLLWYDVEQIKAAGYATFFEFIEAHTTNPKSIWWPLGCAILYTFSTPILKNGLAVFHAWANGLGNKYSFMFSKDSPVKVEMYMKLRDEYKTKEVQVSDLINTETQRNQLYTNREKEIAQLQKEKVDLQTTIQQHKDKISEQTELMQENSVNNINLLNSQADEFKTMLNEYTNIDPIVGNWKVIYHDKNFKEQLIFITKEKIPTANAQMFMKIGNAISYLNISAFLFQRTTNRIFFIATQGENIKKLFYDLRINPDGSLSGFENDNAVVFELATPEEASFWTKTMGT